MSSTPLFIRNMVCNRCIQVVTEAFEREGIRPLSVKLGEVVLDGHPAPSKMEKVAAALEGAGFEILNSKNGQLIEQIKNLLIQKVQEGAIEEHFTLSLFLSKALHREYSRLSKLFSEVEGITIEQFFILQKVEKVKEWLVYDELRISEIAWKLGYSSVAHLSAQFKKITGLTPSQLRRQGADARKPLDRVS